MAKAIRQRIETMLPDGLGGLADAVSTAREAIRMRWAGGADRRRALDAAFASGGALDAPMRARPLLCINHCVASQVNQLVSNAFVLQSDACAFCRRKVKAGQPADHLA